RNRTYNLRFWRPTLCQLSYTPRLGKRWCTRLHRLLSIWRVNLRQTDMILLFLLDDAGHDAGANGTAAFANCEAQTFFHGDRSDQRHFHRHVVTRQHHFLVGRQLDRASHVRRTEVELRTIALEERRVTATLFLGQNVDLSSELRVRLDRTGLGQNLTTLDVFTLGAAQQNTHVVARFALIQQLAEHFHARAGRLDGVLDADDFDFFANLHHTALDTASHHRATTRDREHVFHRHQERAIHSTLRRRDVGVQRFSQLHDGFLAQGTFVAFQRQLGRTLHDRRVVAREVVLGQQLTHFHFHQLEQLFVINHVGLVQEHDDVRHANLTAQQNVLARLRHGAVSG